LILRSDWLDDMTLQSYPVFCLQSVLRSVFSSCSPPYETLNSDDCHTHWYSFDSIDIRPMYSLMPVYWYIAIYLQLRNNDTKFDSSKLIVRIVISLSAVYSYSPPFIYWCHDVFGLRHFLLPRPCWPLPSCCCRPFHYHLFMTAITAVVPPTYYRPIATPHIHYYRVPRSVLFAVPACCY